MARLNYVKLLEQWQPKVEPDRRGSTFADLWSRHMLDSAQIYDYLPPGQVLDSGSGAGFPGLVLAIMAREDDGTVPSIWSIRWAQVRVPDRGGQGDRGQGDHP